MQYQRNNIQNYMTNQWNTFYLYDDSDPNVTKSHYYYSNTTYQEGPPATTNSQLLYLKSGVWIINFNWIAVTINNPTSTSTWYLRIVYFNSDTSVESEIWKIGGHAVGTGAGGDMTVSVISSSANQALKFSIFVGNNAWLTSSAIRIRATRLTANLPIAVI